MQKFDNVIDDIETILAVLELTLKTLRLDDRPVQLDFFYNQPQVTVERDTARVRVSAKYLTGELHIVDFQRIGDGLTVNHDLI